MPATFTVSSQPGKVFHARLSRSSRLLSVQDWLLTLEFDVANDKGDFQGGDYAQVKLKLQRRSPSLWLPPLSVMDTRLSGYR